MTSSWQPLRPEDLPALIELANTSHPSLPESLAVYSERLELFPSGCFALRADSSSSSSSSESTVHGYLISHPIVKHQPPELDRQLGSIPPSADTYYIHDLVVSPKVRGQGLASEGFKRALEAATQHGYSDICLISVYGTSVFWERYGFRKQEVEGSLKEKLKDYGDDAVFMVRTELS